MLDKIIQKIKDLIPKKKGQVEQKVEGTAPAAPVSPDDAKKKKRALIIKIVAGVVVFYVAVDEFILKKEAPEEPVETVVTEKKRGERKPKKSLIDQKPAEAEPSRDVSSAPAEKPPEVGAIPAPVAVEQPVAPTEPSPEVTTEQPETPTPVPTEGVTEVPAETTSEQPETPEPTEGATEVPAETTSEQPVASEISIEEPVVSPTEEVAQGMEKVAEKIGPVPEEEIRPAEKVELPDYSLKGRGLVYNCSGKHWACIDKSGYLSCREHMKWSGENSKSPECVVKNVYNSEEDCSVIQLHYVNTNESTSFCK